MAAHLAARAKAPLPGDARLTALANAGRLSKIYEDRPDDEKIAVIARLIDLKPTEKAYLNDRGAIFEAIRLALSLTALDPPAVRLIFTFAARRPSFLWHLNLKMLAGLMERMPAGSLHDAESRRLFGKVKRGQWWYRDLEGLDITRRIGAAIGEPEAVEAPRFSATEVAASDEVLDIWIDTWTQLIDALRASRGKITAVMRQRSRQAQRIVAAHPEIVWGRYLMNLDDRADEAHFHDLRLSVLEEEPKPQLIDRAWLARLREQEAAWRELGPMANWSESAIPGVGALMEIRVDAEQTLVGFLRTLRAAAPSEKWSKRAAALASGPQGAAVRRALIRWLAGLALSGSAEARSRLWRGESELRTFRRRVHAAVSILADIGDGPRTPHPAAAAALIAFFDANARFRADRDFAYDSGHTDPTMLSEVAALLVRGAIWMLACWRDAETVAAIHRAAEMTLMRPVAPWSSTMYRSLLVAIACILALGAIATPEAVQALGRIRLAVRDERLIKQITKAMELAASRCGVGVTDLEELAVPTFGLDEVGAKTVTLGGLTAALRVRSSTDVAVELMQADGKVVKSVPAALKADAAANASLKQLKAAARSIAQGLPVHRQRIESLYLTRRSWPFAAWRERYLDHPLVGTLARRLIWTVTDARGRARSVMWHARALVGVTGAPARPRDDEVVTLWHPIEAPDAETAAWRAFLMRHRITQPFKQAHRELYPLTAAERATGTYSNRFAGHIIRQHQSVALARLRGWRATFWIDANLPNDEPTSLRIPDFDLAAEFWTEPAGGDESEPTGRAYPYISTDRLHFRSLLGGNGVPGDAVPLDTIPRRIFSEVMRDADLFVSVASIGNDPTWIDGGADAAHPGRWHDTARDYWTSHAVARLDVAGQSRKRFLAELIPSLAIADRCSLAGRHLTVRGRLGTYRIHLGSGNVLMEGDRYLCIVPAARQDADIFLPFEGDRMLSIILSKALMLAADDKITEAAILSQLRT